MLLSHFFSSPLNGSLRLAAPGNGPLALNVPRYRYTMA
jgi:hypothetical protein